MARSSTSFAPGKSGNPSGRPALTEEQRVAREMKAQCQPKVVKELMRLVLKAKRDADRIAAAKALLEEMPLEILDITERDEKRPLEELLAIGLGALLAKKTDKLPP